MHRCKRCSPRTRQKTPLCPRRGVRAGAREILRGSAERRRRGDPRKIGERGNTMKTRALTLALTLAALLLATALAGCVSSQRFSTPAPYLQTEPPQRFSTPSPGGPYTREREDREFGPGAP